MKSLCEGSVVECEVEPSGPGEYHIQYTPTVHRRHELTVSVDGQQVAGSPFPVSVSIHPTQLGKPVRVWRELNVQFDIARNSTDYNNKQNTVVTYTAVHSILISSFFKSCIFCKI